MNKRRILGLAILLIAPSLPLAAGADDGDGLLDRIYANRHQCFLRRLKDAAQGDASHCFKVTSEENAYLSKRKDEFCEAPDQFCRTINSTDPADQAERQLKFVSPRCETVNNSPTTVAFDKELGNGLERDQHFGEMMKRAWGCGEPTVRVVNSSYGTSIKLTYDCDGKKMPFDCDTGEAKKLASAKGSENLRRALASNAIVLAGGYLAKNVDRCTVVASDSTMVEPSGLPPASKDGDSVEDFLARKDLTEKDRNSVKSRLAFVQSRATRIFDSAGHLMGVGSGRFKLAMRATLTEERLTLLEDSFTAAKKGVLAYFKAVKPPVPKTVLDAIENTRLRGLRGFLKDHPSDQESEDIREVEESCDSIKKNAFGVSNAFNSTSPNGGSQVMVCPLRLLEMDLSNSRSLMNTLAHEIGHTVDPCNLGWMSTEARSCLSPPLPPIAQTDPAEQKKVNDYLLRVNGAGGLASCMHAGGRIHAGPGALGLVSKLMKEAEKDGPKCLNALTDYDKCVGRLTAPGMPLESCGGYVDDFDDDENCPLSTVAVKAIRESPHEQDREAFGDFVAANAMPYALEEMNPAFSSFSPEEKRSELLTMIAYRCKPKPNPNNEHPDGVSRIAIMGGNPAIRDAVGCEKPVTPGGPFHMAGCSLSSPAK